MTIRTGDKLTRREREIMDIIFALGSEASAEDIRERMTEAPTYSAVRALLAKMEAKGVVKHREQGLRYVYSPVIAPTVARRSALKRLVNVFFGGSAPSAVATLLREERWTDEELDQMSREIQKARKERMKK